MRCGKGCFVCGKDHRANQKHPGEEVTSAIEKSKSRHPTTLLTVEDLSEIGDMMASDDDETTTDSELLVMWAEDGENYFIANMPGAKEFERMLEKIHSLTGAAKWLHGEEHCCIERLIGQK